MQFFFLLFQMAILKQILYSIYNKQSTIKYFSYQDLGERKSYTHPETQKINLVLKVIGTVPAKKLEKNLYTYKSILAS